MTFWVRLFHVRRTGSSNREGPIADGGQPCTTDIQQQQGSGAQVSPDVEIGHGLELIGEV